MKRKIKEAPKRPDSVTKDQIKNAVSSSDLSAGLANLINAQDEYIKLLTMEIHEMSSYADVDGWKSTKVEEGKRLREEIAKAREQVG